MSSCEKYLDMISAYADDELTESEKAELEAHLAECEECRSVLEIYREMSAEISLDIEDVPEGFSDGVMDKVESYEKNINARNRRRNIGIAGRWIGIAACIAIVLAVFPSMPRLGCGASKEAAMDTATGATMDMGADFDMFADSSTKGDAAAPESAVDESLSFSDAAEDSVMIESEETDSAVNGSAMEETDIGMVVTIYGADVPDALAYSDYSVTYYENGDIEYLVPVSVAREIVSQLDNAEIEELDTDIDDMMAKIIITK